MRDGPNIPDDTMAAIATAPGEAGVAIVRISGPDALNIADRVFRGPHPPPSQRPSHTILYGTLAGPTGDIDTVLLLVMRAPHTYTREDVVEIQGHGGNVAARRILRCVLDAGARLAEPGEFTRRAFLNGRIDLLQAEAVLDLVRAQSDRAAAAAVEQLEGALSTGFNTIYESLLSVATDLEATLDFPEDELPPSIPPEIASRLAAAAHKMQRLLDTWGEGHLLREGAIVVISGKPNVGKSTMLNTLLGRERAIVNPAPGTTRDTIEETLVLDGIPVRLVDTAGLREAECEVEQEGVRRTRDHMRRADLHLYMVDASRPLADDDRAHLRDVQPDRCIVVLNKIDLGVAVTASDVPGFTVLDTSLVNATGVDALRRALGDRIEGGVNMSAPPHAVISERHRRILADAIGEARRALVLLETEAGEGVALAVASLQSALQFLGEATGRSCREDLLDSIFRRFCIGK